MYKVPCGPLGRCTSHTINFPHLPLHHHSRAAPSIGWPGSLTLARTWLSLSPLPTLLLRPTHVDTGFVCLSPAHAVHVGGDLGFGLSSCPPYCVTFETYERSSLCQTEGNSKGSLRLSPYWRVMQTSDVGSHLTYLCIGLWLHSPCLICF